MISDSGVCHERGEGELEAEGDNIEAEGDTRTTVKQKVIQRSNEAEGESEKQTKSYQVKQKEIKTEQLKQKV